VDDDSNDADDDTYFLMLPAISFRRQLIKLPLSQRSAFVDCLFEMLSRAWKTEAFLRLILLLTSISADADGPRDAASRPIDHIALHTMTELDV